MKNSKNFGIDLDDVVLVWCRAFADYANELYNLDIDLRKLRHWLWHESGLMTSHQFFTAFSKFTKEGKYKDLIPVVHARKALNIIRERGHKIHFITSRPQQARQDTKDNLKGLDISYDSLTITNKKGPVTYKYDIDVFIDDKIQNCLDVKKAGVKKVYLFSRAYNGNAPADAGLIRISTWKELIEAEGMKWD